MSTNQDTTTTLNRPIVIAAGGTGGHFIPAEALARVLAARGHAIALMTDRRAGTRLHGVFADGAQFVLPGAGIAGHGLSHRARAALALARGTAQARTILRRLDAVAVVGFGGYPSVPPLLGARSLGHKRPLIFIHEGAVLGQANAMLARFADGIATSFAQVARLPAGARTVLTGMPVRDEIAALYGTAYQPPVDTIRLLVWGGSLGARVFSDVVPDAIARLPESLRARLHVTQQARAEDVERVRQAYATLGIAAEISPFFSNVAELLGGAHLVIGRAGGSSVAELTDAGRPAILVPLPIAASDEQGANAAALVESGAAWMIRQPDFTPPALAGLLDSLLSDPARLTGAARAAQGLARPDAASLFADLITDTIEGRLRPPPRPAYPTAAKTETHA
ncbi:undecaprenyldiphospho-muramoylpentapeptide beta-N-acetylglucosaminyltransferase [Gluconacetobacter diazotrophicus]|uniref:UDP-N-acetylglucosamine--N-acetylmuramyl-(pentapeptide) pyrophosphoryl-undecaprenol N-acetylglucosamine transferase n=1 Tax=Gluconacetobacter diazotrophicus (strain ATCC 49037 / DSM 5601 / CCUG 37298 / CIP 103539 / LMG 7603 / PAl5) TaxID=272568 RepID=A9H0J0_GLUDA|nr:undecaprenyldiphospho-muramoylpentapeptide beta-N-acetylglucosaminyltransferase [Gluconacetobacter diazotrophicus]CAP57134.1 putative UDP-N-acetylglucosamine--N-acetylmuramyl-(pentapeptide pyrophosphoryl-undecaprenol N-acetylglucosamine transferase [Gluconacetobacter diazotrophicus PA1 5]